MAIISFSKNRASITVANDVNLMKSLLDNGVPVASSCSGEGVCAKCRVKIILGKDNLSTPNLVEADLVEIHDLNSNERISCQTRITGDITIDTNYW